MSIDETKTQNSTDAQLTTTLTRFQRDLLAVIAGFETGRYKHRTYSTKVAYGLAIKAALEGRYGEEVNHGRLYPNLDELVDAGLVEKGDLDKRTHSYELTDDGWYVLKSETQWLLGCLGDDQEESG